MPIAIRSPLRRRACAAALLVVVAGGSAGCGSSSGGHGSAAAERLEPLVLDLPSGQYTPGPSGATGPLDAALASKATVVPPDRMSAYLSRHRFQAGYSRIWTASGDYLTSIVLGFADHTAASGLVTEAMADLDSSLGTYRTALPGVPGGQLYGLSGVQRAAGTTLFCAGAWFSIGPNTHTLTLCSPNRPVAAEAVAPFAVRQYSQDSTGPAAGPTLPTP